jgi:phospholipid/cholesterol/gamma-HCH transport system permease protein
MGGMVALAVRTLVAVIRPPYPYGAEMIEQSVFVLRRCWLPLLLCSAAAGYGTIGVEFGEFFDLLGSEERLGAVAGRFSGGQIAPLVTAVVLAGVAGTAICVDLGSRETRHELDALDVLGVDLVKNVVVPRVLALTLLAPLFAVIAQQLCIGGALLAALRLEAPLGEFANALLNSSPGPTGVMIMGVKSLVFGAVAGVVASSAGMSVSRRPDGIASAVSRGVVMSVLTIFLLNYVITYLFSGLTPSQNIVK